MRTVKPGPGPASAASAPGVEQSATTDNAVARITFVCWPAVTGRSKSAHDPTRPADRSPSSRTGGVRAPVRFARKTVTRAEHPVRSSRGNGQQAPQELRGAQPATEDEPAV